MSPVTISRARNFPIGELSRRTGVNIETIRYYERIGMLESVARTPAGRRAFSKADARRLSFVRRARELGFSLGEIRALLALEAQSDSCAEVRKIADRHLHEVRSKIADLRRLESILAETVARCADESSSACPVLDMLEGRD